MKKGMHYPLVLAVIAALCVAGIDVVYSNVAENIKIADEKKALEAVCCIYKNCTAEQMEKVEAEYEGESVTWFRCPAGYAVIASAPGFDGPIAVMAGWDRKLEVLNGIYVLSHTETPGLGGNLNLVNSENTWWNVITFTTKDETGKRPDFQEQFRGLSFGDVKLKQDSGKVDAITAATITSRAVVNAVRKSHEILTEIISKQGK